MGGAAPRGGVGAVGTPEFEWRILGTASSCSVETSSVTGAVAETLTVSGFRGRVGLGAAC
jgi:hypothetical protein